MRKKLLTALTLGVTLTAMTGSAFAAEPDVEKTIFAEAMPAATVYEVNGDEGQYPEGNFFTYRITTDGIVEGEDGTVSISIVAASPMDEESYAQFVNELEELTGEEKEALINNYKETLPLREELNKLHEDLFESEEGQQEQIQEKIDALQAQLDEASSSVSEIMEKAGVHLFNTAAVSFSFASVETIDYEEYIRSMENISEEVKDRLLEIHSLTMNSYDQLDDLYEKLDEAAESGRAAIEEEINALIEKVSGMLKEKSELLGLDIMEDFCIVRSAVAEDFDGEAFITEFKDFGKIDKAI